MCPPGEENENLAGIARAYPPGRRELRSGSKCKSVALFHSIVTLISRTLFVFSSTRFFTLIFRTLLGFFFIEIALDYHVLLGYSFIRKVHQYFVHFRLGLHSIITLISRVPLRSSSIGLLRKYRLNF